MEIKGSGNKYYEVNITELTCTCRDWTCRKHNFPRGDKRRLCKHLIEAIELNTMIPQVNSNQLPNGDFRIINKGEIDKLSTHLSKDDIVIAHAICGDYWRGGTYQTEYIPIVVQLTYDTIPYELLDRIITNLGYKLDINKTYGIHRYYDSNNPLHVIISKPNEFLFRMIYHSIGRDKFMRLSSTSLRKLGIGLSEIGFINKNNEVIDMNISTEEELRNLLGIDSLTD